MTKAKKECGTSDIMIWTELRNESQLEQIQEESKTKSILIFKHSRRCSISQVALDRLERKWKAEETQHIKPYFLDLISYRETSQTIARQFDVDHESPQVLIIEDGESIYDRSHFDIDYDKILKASRS
jgi:bacillithiol system protein YtxJ